MVSQQPVSWDPESSPSLLGTGLQQGQSKGMTDYSWQLNVDGVLLVSSPYGLAGMEKKWSQ